MRLRQHLGLIARGAKRYEPTYVGILRLLIGEQDTVYDVGANIGFYTVLFSSWVSDKGRVIAFEPDPKNIELLSQNVLTNNCQNVVIRDCALAETKGKRTFSVDRLTGSTGFLGSGPTYAETIFGRAQESLLKVKTSTIDDEARQWGAPRLIKMDIEGGEFDTLRGGAAVLNDYRPIVVSELSGWGDDLEKPQRKAELATKLLDDARYSLWDLDQGSRIRPGETAWMMLAVPQERVGEKRIAETLSYLATQCQA